MIVVAKRYPGEAYDVREFVMPNSYMVRTIAESIGNGGDFVEKCLRWVRSNIKYPPGSQWYADWHKTSAFVSANLLGIFIPVSTRESFDFWQFPQETLAARMGDCEDMSILLCSMARTRIPETDVFVTVGDYKGYGHAWVTYMGIVYDASPGAKPPSAEKPPYNPWFRFNDRLVIEERGVDRWTP